MSPSPLRGLLAAIWFLFSPAAFAAGPVRVTLTSRTQGKASATPIYLTVTAKNPEGKDLRMDRQGRFHPCRPEDNTIPRNGTTWCTYSFPLAPSFTFQLDPEPGWTAGRIYLCIGAPLLHRVDPAGVLITPNLENIQDPNTGTTFDWVEFALDGSGFHGNTTSVDQFGLPILLEVRDAASEAVGPVGLPERRSELLEAYRATLPTPFQGLLDPKGLRITAPGRCPAGPLDTYLDGYLAEMWETYRSRPLVLTPPEGTFTGRVTPGDALVFTRSHDPEQYVIRARPTSREVFRCEGALAEGRPVENLLGAHLAALLNRALLQEPQSWRDEKRYYRRSPCNRYAEFWHRHSLGARAYGFPYDDVNDQSTLLYCPDPKEIRISYRID